ncbi:MAG: hypothetical protein ABGX26_03975 [Nautiliaceae bacterium]
MKKYSLFSIIFISLIVLFVYMEKNSVTTFHLFGTNISLQNALWVGLFLFTFYLFSLLFFSFLNLKGYLFKKNIQKDIQILHQNIKSRLLFKEGIKEPKILKDLNSFISLIEGLEIKPKKIEKFELLEDLDKLKKGEIVEIGKYKLKEDNPWFILNVKNKLKKDPSYAKEVLKKFKNEELKKEAFYIWAKEAPINEILKYDYPITLEIILSHIKDENLTKLLEKTTLTPKEEINIAKNLYQTQNPDKELEIIKPLKWGYAYLALKYEHLDLAKEIIEENDLKYFEFFLKLRIAGIKAEIDEYIQSTV